MSGGGGELRLCVHVCMCAQTIYKSACMFCCICATLKNNIIYTVLEFSLDKQTSVGRGLQASAI